MGQGSGVAVSCGEGCRLSLDSQAAVAVAVASSCSSGSTPSLGTSISHKSGPKMKKTNKQTNKKKNPKQKSLLFFDNIYVDFLQSSVANSLINVSLTSNALRRSQIRGDSM